MYVINSSFYPSFFTLLAANLIDPGKMARQLRALVALVEDPGLFASTRMVAHKHL